MASSLQQIVGALIFGANQPLSVEEIRLCLREVGADDEQAGIFADASPRDVRDAAEGIAKELTRLAIGIELVEQSEGFRFQTQANSGRWLRHLLKADRPGRLSRSALETLAIVAYRQPITKSEIEGVRGVGVDHIIKALMELHLIRIVGRSELPGRPFLYGTTAMFLEHFGLKSLTDLNALDPTLQRSSPGARRALYRRPQGDNDAAAAKQDGASSGGKAAAEEGDTAAMREILGPAEPPAEGAEPVFATDDGESESSGRSGEGDV
ncbi:MAG: SMC-Scp complex subunit ScpB [Lentisphaerae bacterium]|jgi:segregation and condensation protein B|nr:SMC-Scp complex subunit ScpB [Lentisphaerota bacterium]